jgi:cell division transport system permease protein
MRLLLHHVHSSKHSLMTILRHPVEHLINIFVLAIIISICALGFSLNNSITSWKNHNVVYPQAMVYLDKNANQADVANIGKALTKLSPKYIREYKFISKAQGLAYLTQDEQMKQLALGAVDANNNPLPDSFVLNLNSVESQDIARLNMQLSQLPMVDNVQIDTTYAAKVHDLLYFATQIGVMVEVFFIVVLTLVVYNIIRLQMLLKSDAIAVSRLIGASDSFIMRPLIHYAIWQVTLASVVAGAIVQALTHNLNKLFGNLINLFGKDFQLSLITLPQAGIMWLVLVVFTIFSVFLAVRWVFRNSLSQ